MKNKIKFLFVGVLMLAAIIFASAGDVLFQDGVLNITDNFLVDYNTLFVDSANNRVGVKTNSPTQDLSVAGNMNLTGSLYTSEAYDNTLIVAKDGGDFVSISNALSSITDNSASNRYLIKVMPGVYNETFTMKSYVDVQGSGWDATVIEKTADTIVTSAENSMISNLQLYLTGANGGDYAISADAGGVINHIKINVVGSSGTNAGVYVWNGGPTILNSYITVSGSNTYGLYLRRGGTVTVINNYVSSNAGYALHMGANNPGTITINSYYNIYTATGGGQSIYMNVADTGTLNSYFDSFDEINRQGSTTFNKYDYDTSSSLTAFKVIQSGSGDAVNIFDNTTEIFSIIDGGNVGVGTTAPNQDMQVIGNLNVSGTVFYGALTANSPHALVNYEDFGSDVLKRTEVCIVANNNKVVLQYLDLVNGSYRWVFEENAQACLDKEVIEEVKTEYTEINGNTTENIVVTGKRKVFNSLMS